MCGGSYSRSRSMIYQAVLQRHDLCCSPDQTMCLLRDSAIQTVLDALRARKQKFLFEGTSISLQSSVMAFITMNPGYPGRAELPESLKVGHASTGQRAERAHTEAGTA